MYRNIIKFESVQVLGQIKHRCTDILNKEIYLVYNCYLKRFNEGESYKGSKLKSVPSSSGLKILFLIKTTTPTFC